MYSKLHYCTARSIKSFESSTFLYSQETFHLRSRFHRAVCRPISITSTIEAYTIAMHCSDPRVWNMAFAERGFETRSIRSWFLSAFERSKKTTLNSHLGIQAQCARTIHSHCSNYESPRMEFHPEVKIIHAGYCKGCRGENYNLRRFYSRIIDAIYISRVK